MRAVARLVAVLVWGTAALLGLYCLGSMVQVIGMLTGVAGVAGMPMTSPPAASVISCSS